jgi:hypothetical protein
MRKAAVRAKELGRDNLANLLLNEAHNYEITPVVTAASVYDEIRDVVRDVPHLSWRAVCKHVADNQGMTLADFLKVFPRAKRVHAEAQN